MTAAYRTRKPCAIIISNVAGLVANKRERLNHTFRICSDGSSGYVNSDGTLKSENDFLSSLPITGEPIRLKGDNPDSSKI